MFDTMLQILAPHHCYGCHKTGSPMCDNCKYNIIDEPWSGCIVCQSPAVRGVCASCQRSFTQAWVVGERHDSLERLINAYKFENVRIVYRDLATLLEETVPALPSSVVVAPVPTVRAHVRERGYDHALLLARQFAKQRGLVLGDMLQRSTKSKQRGATRAQRIAQAKIAFRVTRTLNGGVYLLVDDVVTTGATVQYAAQALLDAGADEVFVAVVARQALDDTKK